MIKDNSSKSPPPAPRVGIPCQLRDGKGPKEVKHKVITRRPNKCTIAPAAILDDPPAPISVYLNTDIGIHATCIYANTLIKIVLSSDKYTPKGFRDILRYMRDSPESLFRTFMPLCVLISKKPAKNETARCLWTEEAVCVKLHPSTRLSCAKEMWNNACFVRFAFKIGSKLLCITTSESVNTFLMNTFKCVNMRVTCKKIYIWTKSPIAWQETWTCARHFENKWKHIIMSCVWVQKEDLPKVAQNSPSGLQFHLYPVVTVADQI